MTESRLLELKVKAYFAKQKVLGRTIGVQDGFTESETDKLDSILKKMVARGELITTKRNNYALPFSRFNG